MDRLRCPNCGSYDINTSIDKLLCLNCLICNKKGPELPFKETDSKIDIEVGKTYLTREGKEVYINNFNNYFIGDNKIEYNYKGHDIRDDSRNDLILEVQEVQEVKGKYGNNGRN